MPAKTRKKGKGGGEDRPSSIEDELDAWKQKFIALGEEAALCGFTTATVLVGFDPISREAWMTHGHTGNFYEAVGGLEVLLTSLKAE